MNNINKNNTDNKDVYVIDLVHIFKRVWQKIWIVILAAVVMGGAGFAVSKFLIEPTYESSVMLYVNNKSVNIGSASFSISSSEISAAQSLVKTYTVILNNRTTLEKVINKAEVDYSSRELSKMITASSVNETEILKVTVTSTDPYEAANIANSIAQVLPERIKDVIDGASMEIVDSAVPDLVKVAPSVTKYSAIGFLIGLLISVAILVVIALMDNTIQDDEYIINTYGFPILAKVPNLMGGTPKGGKYGKYGYGYGKYASYYKNNSYYYYSAPTTGTKTDENKK